MPAAGSFATATAVAAVGKGRFRVDVDRGRTIVGKPNDGYLLTVFVRAEPAPGPVRIVHRAQLVPVGRVDEVAWVWDSSGQLVAQGTQLASVRMAAPDAATGPQG